MADGVKMELSAPTGWIKKLAMKEGGTPQKNCVLFISPTGEQINNKRKLNMYLKSHPGGPHGSDFYWGTGDSPRRSARLVSKAAGSASSHSTAKRQKKSNRKIAEEKGNGDKEGEEAITEKEDVGGEETKEPLELVSTVVAEENVGEETKEPLELVSTVVAEENVGEETKEPLELVSTVAAEENVGEVTKEPLELVSTVAAEENVGKVTKEPLELVSTVAAEDPVEGEVIDEEASRDTPNDENGEWKNTDRGCRE